MLENRQLLTVFTVTNPTDVIANGDGVSLREAIQAANTNQAVGDAPAGDAQNTNGGDTIVFDSTVFAEANSVTILLQDIADFGDLEVTDQLRIDGTTGSGTGATAVTISGNNLNRIFDINAGANGEVSLVGLTMINGNSTDNGNTTNDGRGGAILNNAGSTLAISNSTIDNNVATGTAFTDGGGGIFNDGGTVSIAGSDITNNDALMNFARGGGIFNINSGSMTLTDATVSGNSAFIGGGISNYNSGSVMLTDTTVSGNSADDGGGGIFNQSGSSVTLTNSTVSGNSAVAGGGICAGPNCSRIPCQIKRVLNFGLLRVFCRIVETFGEAEHEKAERSIERSDAFG